MRWSIAMSRGRARRCRPKLEGVLIWLEVEGNTTSDVL